MTNLILKAQRNAPADKGMEGVVFRHPRYGPVEVAGVGNAPLPGGKWEVSLWVIDPAPEKTAFLEQCELELGQFLQLFEARPALSA